MEIIQQLISKDKYGLKCPYVLNPKYITIHNAGNNASAQNEINFMQKNTSNTSFHIAVDDKVSILGIPLDRNAWHAGDGSNGIGNRQSIGIEICYSTEYGTDRHEKAFYNAAEVTKQLMKQFNIPIENVVQHNKWNRKDCPHRVRAEGTWQKFLSLCKEENGGNEEMAKFIEGYQKINWLGQTVHCYRQKSGQDLGMMSAKGSPNFRAVQDIASIDDERVHNCKVNVNYFEMANASIYGQHYGVELTPTMDLAPKQKEWLALWMDKANKLHYSLASDFWLGKNDVKFACSPAAIMLHNGKDVEEYSTACGRIKITAANTQTLLLQLLTGEFVMCVVSGKLNGYQCRDFAKSYGATHISMYDSGGSSQMIVDGAKKVYTGRKIANVLTLYKSVNEPTPEPTPSDTDTINVASVGLRIRKTLSFKNGKANGEVLGFIPVGDKAELIEFVDGIQQDGYQWAKVKYKEIEGYSQYDSMCYWVKDGGKE